MRKTLWLCLIAVTGLGCACGGYHIGGAQVGSKQAYYGSRGDDLRFVILTDGQASHYGISGGFLGPRFTGAIRPATGTNQELTWLARGERIRIGQEMFNLTRGRVFMVSTAGKKPEIRQTSPPIHEQVIYLPAMNQVLDKFCDFPE